MDSNTIMEYKTIPLYEDGQRVDIDVGLILRQAQEKDESRLEWLSNVLTGITQTRQLLQQQTGLRMYHGVAALESLLGTRLSDEDVRLYKESLRGLEWLYEKLLAEPSS